eukprot:4618160-Pleurochrysis_carterae.AAC.4
MGDETEKWCAETEELCDDTEEWETKLRNGVPKLRNCVPKLRNGDLQNWWRDSVGKYSMATNDERFDKTGRRSGVNRRRHKPNEAARVLRRRKTCVLRRLRRSECGAAALERHTDSSKWKRPRCAGTVYGAGSRSALASKANEMHVLQPERSNYGGQVLATASRMKSVCTACDWNPCFWKERGSAESNGNWGEDLC